MFIVAMMLISGGYAVAYWGINNIISWESVGDNRDVFGQLGQPYDTSSLSHGTPAVELSILLGVKKEVTPTPTGKTLQNRHEPPFPYYPVNRTGEIRPISTPTTPVNPNPVVQV